jgi:hypothetical protein
MNTKQRRVRVVLENDEYILVKKWAVKDLVGIDEWGNIIIREPEGNIEGNLAGTLTALTSCCNATAKGCDGYIGCRSCYREIESSLGAPLRESDIYLKVKVAK